MTALPILRAALGAALLSLAIPAPARAQLDSREAIALQNQILELRREIDGLRRGGGMAAPVPRGGGGGGLGTEGVARLQDIEEEIRRLRGRNEVLENQNRQLREDIEKLRGDMDFRLRALEGTGGGGAQRPPQPGRPGAQASAPPQPSNNPPPAPPQFQQQTPAANAAPRPPERALAEGQAALARRDYAAAEAAAREILAQRGGSPRAYEARFLLADALAGRANYQSAAIEYGEAYRMNTRGPRSADALVGFGDSLSHLGQRREACEALDLAQSEYPTMRGPVRARLDAARTRARCR